VTVSGATSPATPASVTSSTVSVASSTP